MVSQPVDLSARHPLRSVWRDQVTSQDQAATRADDFVLPCPIFCLCSSKLDQQLHALSLQYWVLETLKCPGCHGSLSHSCCLSPHKWCVGYTDRTVGVQKHDPFSSRPYASASVRHLFHMRERLRRLPSVCSVSHFGPHLCVFCFYFGPLSTTLIQWAGVECLLSISALKCPAWSFLITRYTLQCKGL